MKIAISGLGRMGAQIAQKLAEGGHEVIAHNRSPEPVKAAAEYGATPAYTKEEVVAAFGDATPIIWLMIPANVIDSELDAWLEVVPEGAAQDQHGQEGATPAEQAQGGEAGQENAQIAGQGWPQPGYPVMFPKHLKRGGGGPVLERRLFEIFEIVQPGRGPVPGSHHFPGNFRITALVRANQLAVIQGAEPDGGEADEEYLP